MKKQLLLIAALCSSMLHAQNFQLSTHTFDLEKIDRHKGWRVFSGTRNNDGSYMIKLGKPSCNMSVSGSTATYKGVEYTFNELSFDQNFQYKGLESKYFPTSLEAMSYEPIYGKRIFPLHANMYVKRALTPEYVGQQIVVPTIDFGGFKVSTFIVGGQAVAPGANFLGATNYYSCSEILEMRKVGDIKTKENKGERWMAVANCPIPNGALIAFATDAIKDNLDKCNYILKLYDQDLNEKARYRMMTDNKAMPFILPIQRKNGKRDFAVIAEAHDSKFTPGKTVAESTKGELFILDGITLELISRSEFKMEFTEWYPEEVLVDDNDELYITGIASSGTKDYAKSATFESNNNNMPDDKPNYQILKTDAQGKVVYVKGLDTKKSLHLAFVVGGTEKKAKPAIVMNTIDYYKPHYFTDKYLILTGQQLVGLIKTGADKANLFIAVFDKSNGQLVKYFIKPEDTYATQDIIFNKDRSTIYWAGYDWESLNDLQNEQGAMSAKKMKNMIAGNLHLAKIDLATLNCTPFEWLGKEQWAVNYLAPVIVKDDESEEIIFQGRTMSKKAKDSELVIIKVKK
jgi:hypothetical protein